MEGEEGEWRTEVHQPARLAYLFLGEAWLVGAQRMPPGFGAWDNRINENVEGDHLLAFKGR